VFDTHADSESSSLLAQLVERTAVNRDVIGSIPVEGVQAPLAQLVRALYLYLYGIHSGFGVTMVQRYAKVGGSSPPWSSKNDIMPEWSKGVGLSSTVFCTRRFEPC
jgi:hypothetical protein